MKKGERVMFSGRGTSVFRVQFTFGLKYNINNHLCYYQIAKKYLF